MQEFNMIIFYKPLLRLAISCLVICSFSAVSAQIVINEYSAANLDRDADDFGKHEDWIELYNKGAASVNLAGWYLSDTEDEPTLWKLGNNITIPAGGYLLFWCSGRDQGMHTNFRLTQTKNTAEVIVLANAAGAVVDKREMKNIRSTNHEAAPLTGRAPGVFLRNLHQELQMTMFHIMKATPLSPCLM